ncbi:MAG: ankyrin repeat domain-containing protein [Candidatus Omnitrophota bacterium]
MDRIDAVKNGDTDVVSTLLDNGTDVNLRNQDRWTALMYARRLENCNITQNEEIAFREITDNS